MILQNEALKWNGYFTSVNSYENVLPFADVLSFVDER